MRKLGWHRVGTGRLLDHLQKFYGEDEAGEGRYLVLTNTEFWVSKVKRNKELDLKVQHELGERQCSVFSSYFQRFKRY